MKIDSYTKYEFDDDKFYKTEDYTELANLISPLLVNYNYKTRESNFWNLYFRKCESVLKNIYLNNFKAGFQHKHFSKEEKGLLVNIFKLTQRIQIYSNNTIHIPCAHLYIHFALSFDLELGVQALKVITTSKLNNNFLSGNTKHIEVMLKILDLPGIKLKKFLFDKEVKFEKTNSTLCDNGLEYFNINKDKNMTDLYVEANKIMCSEREFLMRKAYFLIVLDCKVEGLEEIYYEIVKFASEVGTDDEFLFLLGEFVRYLAKFNYACIQNYKNVFSQFYNEKSSFENISLIRNIGICKQKYYLTSEVNNPDLDYWYFSKMLEIVRKESDIFDIWLDLEDFKRLLDEFDVLHKEKDKVVYSIIFEIMIEVYKKSNAYFDPFEISAFFEKCLKHREDYECIKTITHFINNNPFLISDFKSMGAFDLLENFKCSEYMNIALINLLSALINDSKTKNEFLSNKTLSKMLTEMLIIQNTKLDKDCMKEFTKKHKEFNLEYSDFIKSNVKSTRSTSELFNFITKQNIFGCIEFKLENRDILEIVKNCIRFNDKEWQLAFINYFKGRNDYNSNSIKSLMTSLATSINDTEDLDKIEMYLALLCHTIDKNKFSHELCTKQVAEPIFRNLINLIYLFKDIEDSPVMDIFKDRENILEDKKRLIWNELCFIFKCIWFYEDNTGNWNCFNYFLDHCRFGGKRIKKDFDYLTNIPENALKVFLAENIVKFRNFNFTIFCHWLTDYNILKNDDFWSKDELCDLLSKIVVKENNLMPSCEREILQFIYENDCDSKILIFVNSLVSSKDYDEDMQALINSIYIKNYNKGIEIKWKNVLDNEEFLNLIIKLGDFNNLLIRPDICIKLINDEIVDSNDFLKMTFTIMTNLTFSNNSEDKLIFRNESIDLILKSRVIKRKLKMKFILALLKYLESLNLELKNPEKILKFIVKSISLKNKKNTNLLIKCIILHLFGKTEVKICDRERVFSDRELVFSDRERVFNNRERVTNDEFITDNYLVGFHNINSLRKALLNSNNKSRNKDFDLKEDLFKKLMKYSLKNTLTLNLITEILFNNPKYTDLINEKFISSVIKYYVCNVTLQNRIPPYSDFTIALKFLNLCLQSENINLSNLTIDLIIRNISEVTDHKFYNLILILYTSLKIFKVTRDLREENEYYSCINMYHNKIDNLGKRYLKRGLADKILEKLSMHKESDFKIEITNHIKYFYDDEMLFFTWDELIMENKISIVYVLLEKCYSYTNQKFLKRSTRKDDIQFSEEYEHDSDYVSENSKNPERETSKNPERENIKKKTFFRIHTTQYLYSKEFKLMGKDKYYQFVDILRNYFKDKIKLSKKYSGPRKEDDYPSEFYSDFMSENSYDDDETLIKSTNCKIDLVHV